MSKLTGFNEAAYAYLQDEGCCDDGTECNTLDEYNRHINASTISALRQGVQTCGINSVEEFDELQQLFQNGGN